MNSQKSLRSLASIYVAIAVALLAVNAIAKDNDRDKHNSVVGSWRVAVSFDDGRPAVAALYTFNSDRTFTMGGSWPGMFGPGHGAWLRSKIEGQPGIDLTFFRLLYTPTETSEATGALNASFNGTLKVQARLTVFDDDQGFTGRYTLTNFDAAGNIRSMTTGGLDATRTLVEPLQ